MVSFDREADGPMDTRESHFHHVRTKRCWLGHRCTMRPRPEVPFKCVFDALLTRHTLRRSGLLEGALLAEVPGIGFVSKISYPLDKPNLEFARMMCAMSAKVFPFATGNTTCKSDCEIPGATDNL